MNTQWLKEAFRLEQSGIDFVMVSVLSIKGSTPREVGARMLVTLQHSYGTIGGGHLEYQAIAVAKQGLLDADTTSNNHITTKDYPLGATLGQCCGGFVTLLFENVIQPKFHLAIFGAGHVSKAIVHCLATVPCQVTWIDSRANEFPQTTATHIKMRVSEFPVDEVVDMPENTYYLILTHNHQLDLDLTEAVLKRQDSAFLGVIGSKTKSARFRHRLRDKGFTPEHIAQMHCPMGETDIVSKQPGEIAVSTIAQILKVKAATAHLTKPDNHKDNALNVQSQTAFQANTEPKRDNT